MISPESFSLEWINSHRQNKKFSKVNPPMVEKMIYALALVEAMVRHKLQFVFKGGTSLVILLPEPKRFSVDIDIITGHSKDELETAFNAIVADGQFKKWELDTPRSYQKGVPKAHYFFYYDSKLNQEAGYILLDILFEAHGYPALLNPSLSSTWLAVTGEALTVQTPSIESILGDKLTAFAPNTTGVLYGKNKSLEIVKQLHDVGHLFDHVEDLGIVAASFYGIVAQEIAYRGLEITTDQVLDDIISTALLIGQTPKHHSDSDSVKFKEVTKGMIQFGSYLMTGGYRIDEAIESAAKAAYIAAKIKMKNLEPLEKYDGRVVDFQFESMPHNTLNRLRKIRNGSLFYWSKVAAILGIK